MELSPSAAPSRTAVRSIKIGGRRVLRTTPVFDTYWRFAALRQAAFMRRVRAEPPPWTDDPIIAAHRFTNAYRASDRVSQYLIRHVLYDGSQAPEELFFRAMLFKLFNKIETWEHLRESFGAVSWRKFDLNRFERRLDELLECGTSIYSAAYIMPSPAFGAARKHANHLRLIEHMLRDDAPGKVARARSLEDVFTLLRGYPSLGDFLAFQLTIDLNYSNLIDFSEMEFVVAGPGAKDGIRKCFLETAELAEADLIRIVCEMARDEFARLDLKFETLWGRELQLIDCQNLFCEVDKYARVAHPEVAGRTGRTRIKQKYALSLSPVPQWYPPKWNLQVPVATAPPRAEAEQRRPMQQSLFNDLRG